MNGSCTNWGKQKHWVSRVLNHPKKCLEDLTTFSMYTWWRDSKNMEEIEFSQWLFEGRLRQGKNVLPDGLNWLCYFEGISKSHRKNSISVIYSESPHQLDMKNMVKSSEHFFWVFQYCRNSQWYVRRLILLLNYRKYFTLWSVSEKVN